MNKNLYKDVIAKTQSKLDKRFKSSDLSVELYDNIAKQFIQFYGVWDYEGCFYQIIVIYHPNGKQCSINIISETIEIKL